MTAQALEKRLYEYTKPVVGRVYTKEQHADYIADAWALNWLATDEWMADEFVQSDLNFYAALSDYDCVVWEEYFNTDDNRAIYMEPVKV